MKKYSFLKLSFFGSKKIQQDNKNIIHETIFPQVANIKDNESHFSF